MPNHLPLLIAGGAALFILSGGKKKKKRKPSSAKSTPSDNGHTLPPVKDEDLDEPAPQPKKPTTRPPSSTPTLPPSPTPTEPIPKIPTTPSEPYGKPAIGPTGVGSCANSIYTRDPEYLTPDIMTANNALAAFNEEGYFFYIRHDFQKNLYDYMLERFAAMKNGQERRTVASVVLREGLKHFNSGCKWENPIDTLGAPEQKVWEGGARLAIIAQITVGIQDPGFSEMFATGNRFTITRDSMGETDPGFMNAQNKNGLIGRRIEILASDKSQENAEHIIGEIVKLSGPNGEPNLFEARVVGTFQGNDVSPRLRNKHGFKTGSNAYFSQLGPTGIYRIFPEGME